MPLLTKKENETQSEFISRCMSSETMEKEFKNRDQRLAVCFDRYRKGTKQ